VSGEWGEEKRNGVTGTVRGHSRLSIKYPRDVAEGHGREEVWKQCAACNCGGGVVDLDRNSVADLLVPKNTGYGGWRGNVRKKGHDLLNFGEPEGDSGEARALEAMVVGRMQSF
jgi:hypothetical protein